MIEEFGVNPKDLIVGIGPSLGTCCSEFIEREKDFPSNYHQFFLPDNRVDLWAISKFQLIEKGVQEKNIEFANICTKCNEKDYFSYRANENTGRFGVVIGLK